MRELNPDARVDQTRHIDSLRALHRQAASGFLTMDDVANRILRLTTDAAMILDAMTVPSAAECVPRELLAPVKARVWRAIMRNRFGRVFIGGSVSA